jgi:hypothetical protein
VLRNYTDWKSVKPWWFGYFDSWTRFKFRQHCDILIVLVHSWTRPTVISRSFFGILIILWDASQSAPSFSIQC